MNDPDSTLGWRLSTGDDLSEHLWDYDDLMAVEDLLSAGAPEGLISLAFLTAALKRRAWLWCLTAVLGLLVGSGLYLKFPPAYHASASVLLADSSAQNPPIQILNDQAMAQSPAVAALVVRQLGLRQTVGSFQAASVVTITTDNVLTFNVGAPSASDAVMRVTALATDFLKYRAQYEQDAQQQQMNMLNQELNQALQRLNSINAQISLIPKASSSPVQQAELSELEAKRDQESTIEQYVTNTQETTQTATSAMVYSSRMLGAASPLPRSRLKGAVLYLAGGLIGGLAVGMVIVVITALLSDRLRRRDDVAAALGAPVRLSVGAVRRRRLPGLPGRADRRDRDMRRVVAHLRGAVPGSVRGPVGLAVIAVDNAPDAASAVVSLAASCARDGKQVVVADLARGAVAHLLGAKGPGVHAVSVNGTLMTAVIPDRDDGAPVGPLQTRQYAPASEAVLAAYASADLLLTLAALDPAFGGDHLATWATDAVAIVTAGRSSAERIHAAGEMVRLAGTRLDSVVLIGAEKSDESLGVTLTPEESLQVKLSLGMRFRTSCGVADRRRGSARGWRRAFIVATALTAVFMVVTARLFVWPAKGMPARVDAIVMLAGPGDRLAVAMWLARKHRAPVLVVSQGWEGYGGPCPPKTPDVKLICFDPFPGNTRGEAEIADQLAKQYGWHSVVLVTTLAQDTRARILLRRCFGGSIYVMTASLPWNDWPYQIAYGWGALFKALVLQRACLYQQPCRSSQWRCVLILLRSDADGSGHGIASSGSSNAIETSSDGSSARSI